MTLEPNFNTQDCLQNLADDWKRDASQILGKRSGSKSKGPPSSPNASTPLTEEEVFLTMDALYSGFEDDKRWINPSGGRFPPLTTVFDLRSYEISSEET